jgi:hypothetical protein
MTKQGAFNTRRKYTALGQRIGYSHLTGSVYVFYDVDRIIHHAVDLGPDYVYMGANLTWFKQQLMQEYDHSRYLYDLEYTADYTAARQVAWQAAQSL